MLDYFYQSQKNYSENDLHVSGIIILMEHRKIIWDIKMILVVQKVDFHPLMFPCTTV